MLDNRDPLNAPEELAATREDLGGTPTFVPAEVVQGDPELMAAYTDLLNGRLLSWTSHLRFLKQLGVGGQGVVFLSERKGADGFSLPVAVKIFSPDRFPSAQSYAEGMVRISQVSSRIARLQHDNLLMLQNFIEKGRIRVLAMEWIEGFDLRALMRQRTLNLIEANVSASRWKKINEVVLTTGWMHSRFKPGIAIEIVRDCLAGLASLHREGIVHGDIKPANIMIRRSGSSKIIDYGSAFELVDPPDRRSCTPGYAAIEVLEKKPMTPLSDLTSLGYVLIEMLSGKQLFGENDDLGTLIEAKRQLPSKLRDIMPYEVACNDLLMGFCQRLIAPEIDKRFRSAEDADLKEEGAAAFHRQLVKSDLASEYGNELRVLIEELLAIPEMNQGN